MWSSRLSALLSLMTANTTACAATECPAAHEGHPLSDVGVFDGPPAEMASLEPGDGGWRLNDKPAAAHVRFYLGCQIQCRNGTRCGQATV